MNNFIDPTQVYEPFNNLTIAELKEKVSNILNEGIFIKLYNNDSIVLQTDSLIKEGAYKNIYLLNMVAISDKVYDPSNYILKIRFTDNTDEYFINESMNIPNQGIIPFNMSEGKRYSMLDGEIKKYFADILPTKSNILLKTDKYIVDFIIQERMTMSLDFIRKNIKLSDDVIVYIMNKLFKIANTFVNKGYTFTNFSTTSIMMKLVNNEIIFKLVNTSFLQRKDMIPIRNITKLFATASIPQLQNESNIDPITTMAWNVFYTGIDLLSNKSFVSDISKCCDKYDYECLRNKILNNRKAQIKYYTTDISDNIFSYILNAIINFNNINTLIEITDNHSINSGEQLKTMFKNVITRNITFNKYDSVNYTNQYNFHPMCETMPSEDVDNIFTRINNEDEDEDEDEFLVPASDVFGTVKSSNKPSYTGVGNLSKGSRPSATWNAGNMFDEPIEEDEEDAEYESKSIRPIISSNKPLTLDERMSILEERVNNIDNQYGSIQDKLTTLINKL